MLKQRILLPALLFAFILCNISAHPIIQRDSENLQSIEWSTDKKRPVLPDAPTTIEQVQKLLLADPSLPRLTKGEIEDLFEQVAKEEYEKSFQQLGDIQRANNMRALMLVLPFNTENTTDEVLQELYTRPPITKVIETYSTPQLQKFQTPPSTVSGKTEIVEVGKLAPTTYKPFFKLKEKPINTKPTTYHPPRPRPFSMPKEEPTFQQLPDIAVPVTSLPLLPDIEEEEKKATRYSSSYNANDADWSLLEGESSNRVSYKQKFTPMPNLAGIFKTMGLEQPPKEIKPKPAKPFISSNIQQSNRGNIDIADFTRTLPPRPHLEAYSEFKPLNIGEEIRVKPDIEDYLNRFGIVNRKRKQIKPEDAGLKNNKNSAKANAQAIRRIDTDVTDAPPSNNDEVQLNKLLTNLQELERLNISLTSSMLKPVLMKTEGPDPIKVNDDEQKNESKRQSENDSATESTNDTTTISTPTSTEGEAKSAGSEPQNGSLADLEESFGGPDPVTEDPSPPSKKNGFYFLADWNSFLEVGEAGNDQVVVRFDPKIGDPRRFLKVTVP